MKFERLTVLFSPSRSCKGPGFSSCHGHWLWPHVRDHLRKGSHQRFDGGALCVDGPAARRIQGSVRPAWELELNFLCGRQWWSQADVDVLRAAGHSPSEAYNETIEEALCSLWPRHREYSGSPSGGHHCCKNWLRFRGVKTPRFRGVKTPPFVTLPTFPMCLGKMMPEKGKLIYD